MEPHEAYRRGPRSAAPRRQAAGQDRDATDCDQAHARVGPLILPRTDCRLYYRLISKTANSTDLAAIARPSKPVLAGGPVGKISLPHYTPFRSLSKKLGIDLV